MSDVDSPVASDNHFAISSAQHRMIENGPQNLITVSESWHVEMEISKFSSLVTSNAAGPISWLYTKVYVNSDHWSRNLAKNYIKLRKFGLLTATRL